jgi:hypothetical protein
MCSKDHRTNRSILTCTLTILYSNKDFDPKEKLPINRPRNCQKLTKINYNCEHHGMASTT